MKKKILLVCIMALLSIPAGMADERNWWNFIATAISVADGATAVNGTAWTNVEVDISRMPANGTLTMWFTPAAPAAVNVEFWFSVSSDYGTTWSTTDTYSVKILSNASTISGVVREAAPFAFPGVGKIRLQKVVCNPGAGNLTLVNARVSF